MMHMPLAFVLLISAYSSSEMKGYLYRNGLYLDSNKVLPDYLFGANNTKIVAEAIRNNIGEAPQYSSERFDIRNKTFDILNFICPYLSNFAYDEKCID